MPHQSSHHVSDHLSPSVYIFVHEQDALCRLGLTFCPTVNPALASVSLARTTMHHSLDLLDTANRMLSIYTWWFPLTLVSAPLTMALLWGVLKFGISIGYTTTQREAVCTSCLAPCTTNMETHTQGSCALQDSF